ncbi:MAG: hypothetical protein QM765_33855 [Myxococcales bacterium]
MKKGVTTNEIIPHHPSTSVCRVMRQKHPRLQLLQNEPPTVLD